ncbi:LOW QUALITY PROTEIN: hypothetical protein Smp_127690 [Schistosoma mansoni]|uniref:hypothetical protein n=1 Tax=Schistosoma mansoni TaxID=6183 RepID=UPI00022DC71A|nr:LOW QUALITY PROTEIN: hypothetical protein Smp_127690 [Schistosoma mansoni]|eukprot:XP_018653507.1 LOW QUALITY PROTEIN: hypothetical protein Smp_127690 [Schistosoma mansoni]
MSEGSSILSCGPKRQYGTLESTNTSQNPYKIYNVKPGDTLVSIAVYCSKVQRLRWINRLWSSDISNITTLKVPVKFQSESSGFIHHNSIELSTVKKKSGFSNEDTPQIASASIYFKELSERVEKAKEAASRLNLDYRLPEIIADCDPSKRDCFLVSSLSVTDETVVMVTSPTTSKLNSITDSRKRFCSIPTNSIHDPC